MAARQASPVVARRMVSSEIICLEVLLTPFIPCPGPTAMAAHGTASVTRAGSQSGPVSLYSGTLLSRCRLNPPPPVPACAAERRRFGLRARQIACSYGLPVKSCGLLAPDLVRSCGLPRLLRSCGLLGFIAAPFPTVASFE